jgi:hypothetical protein
MKNIDSPHSFSKAVPKLSMRFNAHELAVGSGLLVGYANSIYLITAAHNLTGRDHDGKLLHNRGARPDEVELTGYRLKTLIRLYPDGDEGMDYPQYIADETRDVAVIHIEESEIPYPLDPSFLDHNYKVVPLRIGDAGFVIGYPRGIQTNSNEGPLPIWKGVTIASEPAFTGPDQPLLIDSWGEKGLSGGPMFVEKPVPGIGPKCKRLVGIYTGRQKTVDEDGRSESLGRVTPLELVLELLRRALN